jgi:hypothetical protein
MSFVSLIVAFGLYALPRIVPKGDNIVVPLAGQYFDCVVTQTIDEPISVVYPPAPKSGELTLERLRLADSGNTVSCDVP